MIDKLLKLANTLDENGQPIVADEIDKLAEVIIGVNEEVVEVQEEKSEIHGGGVHIFLDKTPRSHIISKLIFN